MAKGWLIILLSLPLALFGAEGRFINPITDVCWECLFPITVSGVNVTPNSKDYTTYSQPFCVCAGLPPKAGIPLTFWEPASMIDVTRHAYKMIGLGGVSIGNENIKNRGSVGIVGDGPSQSSFYQVHYYHFPLMAVMEMFTDFSCLERGALDIGYLSELDPLWNDEELSFIINAEAVLFGNSPAQLACIADCAATSLNRPLDKLFWCAGCNGSLYPFTGTVAHHQGGIQASALLVHRLLAKLHRSFVLKGFTETEFCEAKFLPVIKKSLYKTQLVYPIAQTTGACQPLGKTSVVWGAGMSYPHGGEDFCYLIWTKKQCCLDAVKVVAAAAGGG